MSSSSSSNHLAQPEGRGLVAGQGELAAGLLAGLGVLDSAPGRPRPRLSEHERDGAGLADPWTSTTTASGSTIACATAVGMPLLLRQVGGPLGEAW